MLEPHPDGVLLTVKAQPGSKRNEVRGVQDGALKVCVTQIPEKGKANKAVREQIARTLGLRVSQVELTSGETSAQKKFLLSDVALPDIQKKIDGLLGKNLQ